MLSGVGCWLFHLLSLLDYHCYRLWEQRLVVVTEEVMAVVDSTGEGTLAAAAIGAEVTPVFTVTEVIAITAGLWALGMYGPTMVIRTRMPRMYAMTLITATIGPLTPAIEARHGGDEEGYDFLSRRRKRCSSALSQSPLRTGAASPHLI